MLPTNGWAAKKVLRVAYCGKAEQELILGF